MKATTRIRTSRPRSRCENRSWRRYRGQLYKASLWRSNAYYLYGYGIELGLKSYIARQVIAETIPDKEILRKFLTHRLVDLIALAGLSSRLSERRKDAEFDTRWAVVAEWSEEARYDIIDAVLASAMHDAVENPAHGVMAWLKQYW